MKRYKCFASIVVILIIILTISGCNLIGQKVYTKYAVVNLTSKEVKDETEKAEKYLRGKYPEDEIIVEKVIGEVYQHYNYPVYTINCIDKTKNIKFYVRDGEKQLREPLKDNLEFCSNNKRQQSDRFEYQEEIKNEIGKYFDITDKNNFSASIIADDLDGGTANVGILVKGKEILGADFKSKTDKIISYLKMYKEIGFTACYRYTDSNGIKRYHYRKYFTNTNTDTVQFGVKDK